MLLLTDVPTKIWRVHFLVNVRDAYMLASRLHHLKKC